MSRVGHGLTSTMMQSLRSTSRIALTARAFSTTTARPLAKVQLIGRLADVPEVTPTSTGREVTRFALGVSHGNRDENGDRAVSWFRVSSFMERGPRRDVLTNLPKGALIFVDADAKMDTYDVEGSKRNSLNLVARNFEVLSRPRQDSSSETDAAQEPDSGLGAS
ncbi:hypothetical protein AMS68_004209 [Peltaster fructicola]|uniref:SsDNA binding protein n=1 Tax=Peltaster fructicola TaxID=286661 RepID=A0A6H0XVA4_9PEZI|nr:hypothetical protein AMS68_004209 [Peltaster fructicola]